MMIFSGCMTSVSRVQVVITILFMTFTDTLQESMFVQPFFKRKAVHTHTHIHMHTRARACTHTHTHTHTCWFLWFTGTFHRRNGFYTVQAVCAIALHLNLALTGDGAFIFSLKKTHTVWFISVLNYGDTENVLINHLLLVIPMSYPCQYKNLCPHKPHKHAHTHTHTHTHTHIYIYIYIYIYILLYIQWRAKQEIIIRNLNIYSKCIFVYINTNLNKCRLWI